MECKRRQTSNYISASRLIIASLWKLFYVTKGHFHSPFLRTFGCSLLLLLPPPRRSYTTRSVCLSFCLCLSVCLCSLRQKSYVWMYIKFLSKVDLGPASRWFHFGGDPDWPSMSFSGHSRPARSFQHKIDYNTLLPNRKSCMFCPMAPSSMTLQHVSRSNQETICFPRETYAYGSGHHHRCPIRFLLCENLIPVRFWPWRSGGLRSLWVLSSCCFFLVLVLVLFFLIIII